MSEKLHFFDITTRISSYFRIFVQKDLMSFIDREILTSIRKHLDKKEITVIIGARQVGKTSLLKIIEQGLLEQGETVHYLSLENLLVLNELDKDPEGLFKFFPKPRGTKKVYCLLDEIQYAQNPSHLLKYLYDFYAGQLKLLVTGSSAFYIDNKFKDSLSGRKRIFTLNPLSFGEYIKFKQRNDLVTEYEKLKNGTIELSLRKTELQVLLEEYLVFGAYPRVVLENDPVEKKFLLHELLSSYITKDIREAKIDKEKQFIELMTLLSEQVGSLVNKTELGRTLQISDKTVDRFLYVMRKSFHVHFAKPFYQNKRKEITQMPKVYFNDLGMRNAMLNNFSPLQNRSDKGELLENYTFNALRTQNLFNDVKFWRDKKGHEVDFIVEETPRAGKAFEIKFNLSKFNRSKYSTFMNLYPAIPLNCIFWEGNSDEEINIIKL